MKASEFVRDIEEFCKSRKFSKPEIRICPVCASLSPIGSFETKTVYKHTVVDVSFSVIFEEETK